MSWKPGFKSFASQEGLPERIGLNLRDVHSSSGPWELG